MLRITVRKSSWQLDHLTSTMTLLQPLVLSVSKAQFTQKGMYVVVRQDDEGLHMGEIIFILINHGDLYLRN